MKPNLVDLPTASVLRGYKRTEILIRAAGESEFKHHCAAIALEEIGNNVKLLCAIPCIAELGKTFGVRRVGFPSPVQSNFSGEQAHIRIREKDFGHVYEGNLE